MQDLDELFDQMGRAADKLFDRAWLQHFTHICWEPEVNVYECRETLVFLVNLPGVSRDQISIHLVKDTLIIAGIRQDPRPPDAIRCLHLEMPQGRFRKQIRIALPIRRESLKAELSGGILRITVAKETHW